MTPDLPSPTQLDLGCGRNKEPGWFGIDHYQLEQHNADAGVVDLVWDLEQRPWPIAGNCATAVVAHQVIEHIRDLMGFMNELWRVCAPGAWVEFTAPYCTNLREVYGSPDHVRGYSDRTFLYFEPGFTDRFTRYPIEGYWHIVEQAWKPDANIWILLRPIKTAEDLVRHEEERLWRDRKPQMLG